MEVDVDLLRKILTIIKDLIKRVAHFFNFDIVRYKKGEYQNMKEVRREFAHLKFASLAIQKLLDEYKFTTVLDIGSGSGEHSDIFLKYGKEVTSIDYGRSHFFRDSSDKHKIIIGDFNTLRFDRQFDCVFVSHVLEHQLNVGFFLKKIHSLTKEKGIIVITVPPFKHEIVGGHVSLWNAGILLYNLVLAGFNCKNAKILKFGYNISVIIRKETIGVPALCFDAGDVDRIGEYLPDGLSENFDGDIVKLNW